MNRKVIEHDTIGIVLFVIFAFVMAWQSLKLGLGVHGSPGPGLFPFLSATAIGVLSLMQLILKMRRRPEKESRLQLGAHWLKGFYLILITFLYVVLFWNTLGYLISTFLWLFVMLRMGGIRSWKQNILIPMGITITSYFLLEKVAYCFLPRGLLGF